MANKNLITALTLSLLFYGVSMSGLTPFTLGNERLLATEQREAVDLKVIPGGHSIGVVVKEQGVAVVGFSGIELNDRKRYPAKESGLQIGDIIIEINGTRIISDVQTAKLVAQNQGETITIKVKRGKQEVKFKIRPVYDAAAQAYRIGIYVRDSAAGVGTLTFYDPSEGAYGALGHEINDEQWQVSLRKGQGRIIQATIQGIAEATRGQPGEKIGLFVEQGTSIAGDIRYVNKFGIFGHLDQQISNSFYPKPIPLAAIREVHPGPAELLTVIEGDKIERFQIEIERILSASRPDGRGMVILITDRKLLAKTGGIVQGMSGSPIIQDGKLAGAVTHVFVQDPTRGYGVFAQKMVEQVQLFEDANYSNSNAG